VGDGAVDIGFQDGLQGVDGVAALPLRISISPL